MGVLVRRHTKTRRTYRLRDMLRHVPFCRAWQEYVAQYDTAEEVLAAVNAKPGQLIGLGSAAFGVRFAAWQLAVRTGKERSAASWDRRLRQDNDDAPITAKERDRFIKLWLAYADKHGLYTDEYDVDAVDSALARPSVKALAVAMANVMIATGGEV